MSPSVGEMLHRVPFFSSLSPSELAQVSAAGSERYHRQGEVVFHEGEEDNSLFVLLEGQVEVVRRSGQGSRICIARFNAGEFFGELALLDSKTRSASIESATDTRLFVLERQAFLRLLSSERILSEVLARISSRMRESGQRIFDSELQREVESARAEVARHRAISEMVAGVAHEINTPLGVVNNAASIITESLTDSFVDRIAQNDDDRAVLESVVEAGNWALKNVAKVDRLVQSFKNLSVHHTREAVEECDLVSLTQEIIDMFSISMRNRQLGLTLDNQLGDDRQWTGVAGHYSQILLNFLSNAERYAYPEGGSGPIRVRLATTSSGGQGRQLLLTVEDQGVGIPEDAQKKVFDAFYTTGRGRGGTGLGMSIAQNLVTQSLKGDIWLESVPGQGSRFLVRFPRSCAPQPDTQNPA